VAAPDPHHLLTTGGPLSLDWRSGIDWKAIMRLKVVDVPALHAYSEPDLIRTTPAFASLAQALGKPWITEEFGQDQARGDASRAVWFSRVYAVQVRYGSAGSAFWNLGKQTRSPTCDVNSSTPLTLAVVRSRRGPSLSRSLWTHLSHVRP
jgi:hypothetical protein